MFRLLRRVTRKIDSSAGLSIERTRLYRMMADQWSPELVRDPGITWHMLTPEALLQLREIGPFDVVDGRNRIVRGDLCYAMSVGGRIAHYSWVQRSGSHPITTAGISVPIKQDEFWIFNCRTAEWAQGRGFYRATLKRIVDDQFRAAYKLAWIYTSSDNFASQKGILRAGFDMVSALSAVRLGSRYYALPITRANNSL
jgi:hypothetical protein